MARRSPWCVVGIPNDSKNSYKRNPIPTSFWHKSSHPSGS